MGQMTALASAEDADDFKAKLESLEEKWKTIAPSFHGWFTRVRSKQFVECVIESADSLFYNNVIESLHVVLKTETGGTKLTLIDTIKIIKKVIDRQQKEEIIAIYQSGKYRLSKGYKQFEVKFYSLKD